MQLLHSSRITLASRFIGEELIDPQTLDIEQPKKHNHNANISSGFTKVTLTNINYLYCSSINTRTAY